MTPTGQRIVLTFASLAAASIVTAIPASRGFVSRQLDRVRNPDPLARRRTMFLVFLVSIAYLLFTAWEQNRDMFPKFHDEFMHLLQMRMLAAGRLWTPEHPLADFFETFHVLVKPVYASIYFPGTALLYVPQIWLHLPFWFGPLMVAGGSVALLYRIVTELIDGVAGLLAALLLISLDTFRLLSLAVMSHGAIIFLGLAVVWAYLRWRDKQQLRYAIAMGALAGWAAITRPIDAIAFALPVALAVILTLRTMTLRSAIATLACAFAAAAPFLALQLVEDVGITGHLFETPYQLYARQDSPGLAFGFHPIDPNARPQSALPQKQLFYSTFLLPEIERHRWSQIPATWLHDRLPLLMHVTLPNILLVALFPFSLFAFRRQRWVLWMMFPLYLLLYVPFPFLLRHYAVVPAASIILGVLMGKKTIERWSSDRSRFTVGVFLTTAIAALAITALPEIDRDVIDDGYLRPTMWFVARELPKHVQTPAIVLFRFTPGDDFHEEPVYNVDVLNPDDAPIIRAHDLGPARDRQLIDYYAKRQPDRTVYLYDRHTHSLNPLGNVADLAREIQAADQQK